MRSELLDEIVGQLVRRPGHEAVRHLVADLLHQGLGASLTDLFHEHRLPEVHGRADALLGRTILEFKSNLRRERQRAEEELERYLRQREAETGDRYIGVATDGAEFITYRLSDNTLVELTRFSVNRDRPRDVLRFLDGVVVMLSELEPDPAMIERYLGRGSPAYEAARLLLAELWGIVRNDAGVRLKRDLWARFLQMVYGSSVDEDELFFQHTYLTVVAKALATLTLGVSLPRARELLDGQPFEAAGIHGAVEGDFFDWILNHPDGEQLVGSVGKQVARFRLTGADLQHDVLKVLYETLIDPAQRHELGEYYTPDWLAEKMCDSAITNPLDERVLDPGCGSGTFLFHAVKKLVQAAHAQGLSTDETLQRCTHRVIGVDVHPVAVIIARVTYLLALGPQLLRSADRRVSVNVPVYLGDSLQWNTERMIATRSILIEVPDAEDSAPVPALTFPWTVTSNPAIFDSVVRQMLELSEQSAPSGAMKRWLDRHLHASPEDHDGIVKTYKSLSRLRKEGRNHIWGYVARNLARPLWLSSEEQRAQVVIGNPPWLTYRLMTSSIKARFRDECKARGLWSGGALAAHQDLAAYFFARCAELYLAAEGKIVFVMPLAAVRARQYDGFRTGRFGEQTVVEFTDVWTLDERVQPLFPMPACVMFARAARVEQGTLGKSGHVETVRSYTGLLPRRDATLAEAEAVLRCEEKQWTVASDNYGSPYAKLFRPGATLIPRMLWVVERVPPGTFGANPTAPAMRSARSTQENLPWRAVPSVEGTVEEEFLRPMLSSESVAPFRILNPLEVVLPEDPDTETLLDAKSALDQGYSGLSGWLRQAEALWDQHGSQDMTLIERLDYHQELSAQLPVSPIRVVYSSSGALPAAAVVQQLPMPVNNYLWWMAVNAEAEAHYLAAIINSETLSQLIAPLQPRGQWGGLQLVCRTVQASRLLGGWCEDFLSRRAT